MTIGATVLPVMVAALAGYALAWIDFPGRDWIFLAIVGLMVVPIQMALIPMFTLYNNVEPVRHRARADPLPHGVRAAVRDLPAPELLHRDPEGPDGGGAHRRRVGVALFFKVVLPLGLPAIAALAIFQVLFVWNDLLVGLRARAGQHSRSPPTLAGQLRQFGSNLDVIAPASFFSAVIPLTIFALFQRYFVQGLLAGSVK